MTKQVLYVGLNPIHYKTEGKLTHFPLIEIIPRTLADPQVQCSIEAFSAYTHVIITSKSTVKILKDYISLEEWIKKRTIAVGQITAKSLNEIGIEPSVIATEETAEGLIDTLKSEDLSKAFVFWPHAALARPLIANYLYFQGIPYSECILYDTKLCEPAELPDLSHFNEIVFTSPSTVDAFVKNYGMIPQNIILTAIGPITKSHLEAQMDTKFSTIT